MFPVNSCHDVIWTKSSTINNLERCGAKNKIKMKNKIKNLVTNARNRLDNTISLSFFLKSLNLSSGWGAGEI